MVSVCTKIRHTLQASTITVDELGKAKSFRMFSLARPHMRSFHTSWFCFFIAFTSWFGIQPLIPEISKELQLSKKEIAYSGIASISATILVRILVGPLCDRVGPRRVMSALLCVGSIPLALSGLIRSGTGLIVVRFCIGVLGGSFIPCQFWTSAMFNTKIVGTANALVGGWGNLGGGFTFLLMPAIFEVVMLIVHDEFLAWKISVVVPAVIVFTAGVIILWTSDDCPQGKWADRKLPKKGTEMVTNGEADVQLLETTGTNTESPTNGDVTLVDKPSEHQSEGSKSTRKANLWQYAGVAVLMLHYGLSFGIEIAVNTVLNLYLLYNFKMEGCTEVSTQNTQTALIYTNSSTPSDIPLSSTYPTSCSMLTPNSASLIASLFGLMNLFARALGGFLSDILRKRFSGELKGRVIAHTICLVSEGIMLIVFSQLQNLSAAVVIIVFFSLSVQMTEGTTFAIVPYVNPTKVGLISGFVGSGGNIGAMIWNTIWSGMVDNDPTRWFWTLGVCVLSGSLFSAILLKLENTTQK